MRNIFKAHGASQQFSMTAHFGLLSFEANKRRLLEIDLVKHLKSALTRKTDCNSAAAP